MALTLCSNSKKIMHHSLTVWGWNQKFFFLKLKTYYKSVKLNFPRYLCRTFGQILIKIHKPVREEVQLKLMKVKISKTSSLTYYHFSHRNVHSNDNRFLTDIKTWGRLTSFLRSEVTRNTLQNFLPLSSGYFRLFCNEKSL